MTYQVLQFRGEKHGLFWDVYKQNLPLIHEACHLIACQRLFQPVIFGEEKHTQIYNSENNAR